MFRKDKDNALLNAEIERVLAELKTHQPNTSMYTTANDNLEKLYKMKASEKSHRVKPETLIVVAGNLLGIGWIVGHERAHALTSKALSFVVKPRG